MEHDLLQLLHLPPQDHLTMVNSGLFGVASGDLHAPCGDAAGFVVPAAALAGLDDCGWMEDLMHFGEELFGGDDNASGTVGHQPLQCGGGSPVDHPLPSVSMDGEGSPPSVEQGAGEQDDVSAGTRKRRDRSKTIVSERKRRVRMKEKLYELRALVPNITKMDKASIIADAVVYVKNLQAHAMKLKEEVAALETQPRSAAVRQQQQQQKQNAAAGRRQQGRGGAPPADCDGEKGNPGPAGARVTNVGATQVGHGRFFVTVECERRDGVAAPLCAAVESLACFRVESSSLGRSGPDRVVSTHVLKASDQLGEASIGEGTVKLWVIAALLKEGFQPEATVGIS
ncbi:hypothetical protein PR202_gb15921 [Eleusine coracana subsp. coracana]|uniref:BHLH domain-containing protein n=1 Tax=Eleusine coracana subsp. coracana TaxID=191504 RepID=A0AAV5F0A0_ELECO|nr:hypothetical protein QOZ80_4BG0352140 [Eleusine coracana subsp. coracana]GJN27865.1 hypothetical protein PR202_gb15921 [Eleusine coracana subsp. coracana]